MSIEVKPKAIKPNGKVAWNIPTTASAFRKAEEQNLEIVYPKENELQLDIDNKEAYDYFHQNKWILEQWFGIRSITERVSKSGGDKKHITVELGVILTTVTRILLQAVMGSDKKRELYSFIMYAKGNEKKPTLLLEKRFNTDRLPQVKDFEAYDDGYNNAISIVATGEKRTGEESRRTAELPCSCQNGDERCVLRNGPRRAL